MQEEQVRAAINGDERAFEALYVDMQPRLLRYLTSLVGQDAADVAAETWLEVVRGLGRFKGSQSDFRGWVITIGRHRALDALRAAGRRRTDAWDPLLIPEQRPTEDAAELGEEAMATQEALRLITRLPPDQAEAVLLQVVVGLTSQAAARVLGKRPGAVRMATSRGLARLEEMLMSNPGVTVPASRSLTH